jgi:Cupin
MDALSDVLRIVRLKGGVFLHAEFTAPWCIFSRFAPEDCGKLLEGIEHIVLYHYVIEGRLAAQIPNHKPVEVATSIWPRCRRERSCAPRRTEACW